MILKTWVKASPGHFYSFFYEWSLVVFQSSGFPLIRWSPFRWSLADNDFSHGWIGGMSFPEFSVPCGALFSTFFFSQIFFKLKFEWKLRKILGCTGRVVGSAFLLPGCVFIILAAGPRSTKYCLKNMLSSVKDEEHGFVVKVDVHGCLIGILIHGSL